MKCIVIVNRRGGGSPSERVRLTSWVTSAPRFVPTDMYTFVVPEDAGVGATVGRITALDGDVGANARMNYSLADDVTESSTFSVQTDPETQEGVILLAKVSVAFHYFLSAEA